jgi:hypothetical protein
MKSLMSLTLEPFWGMSNIESTESSEENPRLTSSTGMFTFIVRQIGCEPLTLRLNKAQVTIGRSTKSDIHICDPFASRVHAEIKREGDQFFLRDADSANGTYLNGQRVKAAMPIRPGDRILIGGTEIEYSSEE